VAFTRLEQLLLFLRQVERGAIAALEAGLVDAVLLALEVGGDAHDGHDDVRVPGGGDARSWRSGIGGVHTSRAEAKNLGTASTRRA